MREARGKRAADSGRPLHLLRAEEEREEREERAARHQTLVTYVFRTSDIEHDMCTAPVGAPCRRRRGGRALSSRRGCSFINSPRVQMDFSLW